MVGGDVSSSSSAASSSSPSSGAKRGRDPEDEMYLDNFHSHKRYLSEIMASSLNGLTVGDALNENLMESPSRSETICNPRDDIASQYSPMSEDSDDARFHDTSSNMMLPQSDPISNPTSPVSPHRYQKPAIGLSASNPYPLPGCTLAAVVCSLARQRVSDSDTQFPSSPNDMCHTPDLRKAALLRSMQMRSQPHCPPAYELSFHGGDRESLPNVEEDQSCGCIKTFDDETVVDCSSGEDLADAKLGHED